MEEPEDLSLILARLETLFPVAYATFKDFYPKMPTNIVTNDTLIYFLSNYNIEITWGNIRSNAIGYCFRVIDTDTRKTVTETDHHSRSYAIERVYIKAFLFLNDKIINRTKGTYR